MISNQILQTTIDGLKGITRIDLCICETEGKWLAPSFPEAEEYENSILSFVDSPADSQVIQGYQFFKVFDEHQLEYILLAKGSSDDVYMVGKLAAFQIQNLLVAYKERFDKDNFIKNLLLDNLLLVDIYNRAKKLHIETNVRRVVFLIETKQEKDVNALETVRSLFATKTKDFITAVDEKNIILVKEVKPNEDYADLEKTASVILDMLSSEAMTKVRVAYGTVVNVSRKYPVPTRKRRWLWMSARSSTTERTWLRTERWESAVCLSAAAAVVPYVHPRDLRRQIPGASCRWRA